MYIQYTMDQLYLPLDLEEDIPKNHIHQRATDTRCLQPHMEKVRKILEKLPQTVIAHAGYGSEENYAYLKKEKIQAVVKYGSYHKENSKAWKEDIGKIENWTLEVGWLSLAHNLLKQAANDKKRKTAILQ
uniref:hypothetical protein n=1 Tax=Paenibacillus albidus TaxID=2041023 RepID=UPI002035C3C4|nr:hypothetical protein [Paenibacillus albidus]